MIATSTKLRGPRCERIGPREISVIKVVFEPRLTILKYGERSKSHEMPYRSRGRRWLHRRRFVEICQLQHADLPAYRTVREGVPQGHRVHGRSNRPPIRHAQHGGPVALPYTAAGSDRGVRAPRASGYSELRAKKSSISGTTAYLHLGGIGNGSIGMGQSGWGKSRVRQPSAIMRRRLCAERCRVQRIARGPHAAQVDCVRYLIAVEILRFPATEHVSRPECSRESRWVRIREGFISTARVRQPAGDAGANPIQRLVEDLHPQASASRPRRRSTGIQPQLRHEST